MIAKAKLAGMWREKVEQSNSGPVIVEVNRPPSELTGEPDASVRPAFRWLILLQSVHTTKLFAKTRKWRLLPPSEIITT